MSGRRAAALAAALLAGAGVSGCGDGERYGDDDPRTTVSRLLLATVGQANGAKGCALLTETERVRLDAGPAGSCRAALGKVGPLLQAESDAEGEPVRVISKLEYAVERRDDDRAVVRVTGGARSGGRGLTLRFTLVREDRVRPNTTDPGVPWRVAEGVDQLLRG